MRFLIRSVALIGIVLVAVAASGESSSIPPTAAPAFTILEIGQSNMAGTNGLAGSPLLLPGAREDHIPLMFNKNRTFSLICDPVDAGASYYQEFYNPTAGASVTPGMVRRLLPTVGNILVIPMAKGGTAIGSWLYRAPGATSYLDKAVAQARASGQTPTIALWWQGESDSKLSAGTTGAQYKAYLTQIAERIYSEFGCPLMVCAIETISPTAYPNQTVIRQAQYESWIEVPHVVQGPDLVDINVAPENEVHLAHPAKIDLAAARWATAVLNWWTERQP